MILLSVTLEKCSGCAIMKNGKILYSSSEERFSRVKSDSSFPKKSILPGTSALRYLSTKGFGFWYLRLKKS